MKVFRWSVVALFVPLTGWAEIRNVDSRPVAKMGDVILTEKELQAETASAVFELQDQLYQTQRSWIDRKVRTYVLEQAAKEAKLSTAAFLKREIEDKIAEPTADEIEKVFSQNPQIPKGSDQAKKEVTDYLKSQKRNQMEQALYQKLVKNIPIDIYLTKPEAPKINIEVSSDDPVEGSKKAVLTLVEFTDIQCPWCKRSQDPLHQVLEAYKGKVKVVAKQFPLPMHPRAKPAALASLCAHEQGKFWSFREKLFEDQQKLNDDDFKRVAKEVGLNTAKFDKCYSEGRYNKKIEKDIADGQKYGVRGTPTFYLEGRPVPNAIDAEAFKSHVGDVLSQQKS